MDVVTVIDVGGGKFYKEIMGKSTETKPTVANLSPIGRDLADNSLFIETDTEEGVFYNAATDSWG